LCSRKSEKAYFFHSWHRLKSKSCGLLYQKATHSPDILNWLIDSPPVSVYALSSLNVFGGKPFVLDDFVHSLCGNRKPLADGRTGTMSSAIVDAAERSIVSGNAEKIKSLR